jgi:hypothetical protein
MNVSKTYESPQGKGSKEKEIKSILKNNRSPSLSNLEVNNPAAEESLG